MQTWKLIPATLRPSKKLFKSFSYIRSVNKIGRGEQVIKISDLRNRDVINVLDGKKLGNIMDIDLDLESGRVLSLIMPGQARRFNLFSRREEITVPWHKIVRIGRDVILVEVPVANNMEDFRRDYLDNERY